MSEKEQTKESKEPLSYKRNCLLYPKPDEPLGLFLHTQPCPEVMAEDWLVLATLDGYAVIPVEAYLELNVFEQLQAFYNQVGDGQIALQSRARLTAQIMVKFVQNVLRHVLVKSGAKSIRHGFAV